MSLKIKLMSCFSLLVMMLGLLIVGVFASTRTINLKGSVDFNISDTTLYVKDIRLQTETTGAAETIENFMPGYTNTTFDLNLGTVTSSSGIVTVYFDFINTTSTTYSATATGGNGVILSTSGTIEGSEIPITDVTTYGGISGTITLTIQLASGTSGDISLDGIVVTIDEYVPEPNIIAISSNEALGQAQGAIAEIGDQTTISADFIGNADADFLGWKTSLEAEDFVSTLPDYTFNLEESSPTTYYAIFTEPNEYLTYNYDTPRAAEAELASCSSGAKDIIVPSAIYRSSISYNVTSMDASISSSSGVFYQARSTLQSVSLPQTITTIGSSTFSDCRSLTSITIPDSVITIGDYAFYNCYSFTSIAIPAGVTIIGDYAFSGCSGLETIEVEEGNREYHSDGNCLIETNSKTLIVGSNNSVIPTDGSVTSIGWDAFNDRSGLRTITIPSSVTSIGPYALFGCSGLETIEVEEGNRKYHSDGNCLIETNSKELILGCKNSVIPTDGSVTSIGYQAFSSCSGLTSISIPDSVTNIGSYAFDRCSSLTSITLPSSLTSIGSYAFDRCSSLTSITIPDGVTSIGSYAFYGCSNLTSVTFGENSQLTTIEEQVFRDCGSLANITIPEGVTSIGNSAFSSCSGLKSITIPDSVTSIGEWAFANCYSLTGDLAIPVGVTIINDYAFYYCSSLTNITIPAGVTAIGRNTFSGCSSLTNITIPEGVTSIGMEAFNNCSSLTSITISSSVTSISSDAFNNCYKLATIYIDSSKVANGITSSSSFGNLTYYARTLYIKDTITVTSVPYGFTVDTSGSDVAGYVKYIKA